jgi:uncharacterized repeat protein (TIGR03943 family)
LPERSALLTRWLGVGLAAILSVVTISLFLTGRLGLYINPDSAWFAVGMAVVVLVGAVASFLLPLGAEADHGHDHGEVPVRAGRGRAHDERGHAHGEHEHAHGDHHDVARGSSSRSRGSDRSARSTRPVRGRSLGLAVTATGAALASAIVLLALVLPPRSLSAELAISRDVGAPPLFAGTDVVTLARTGDTASFGVGEWSAVFATATNPEAFDGDPVTLTGFVTPGENGELALSRLVITHCVIDAQSASVPVAADGAGASDPDTGQWVTVDGVVRANSDGRLFIDAASIELIDEPEDPYEY